MQSKVQAHAQKKHTHIEIVNGMTNGPRSAKGTREMTAAIQFILCGLILLSLLKWGGNTKLRIIFSLGEN